MSAQPRRSPAWRAPFFFPPSSSSLPCKPGRSADVPPPEVPCRAQVFVTVSEITCPLAAAIFSANCRAQRRSSRGRACERSDGRPLAGQKGSEHPADSPGRAHAADLLRAALEKVVFFEWRVAELSAQLVHAEERASAAMRDAAKASEERSVAEQRARM